MLLVGCAKELNERVAGLPADAAIEAQIDQELEELTTVLARRSGILAAF